MRKKRNYKRDYNPDLKYQNVAASRFINYLMEDGKKFVAEKIFYQMMDIVNKKTGQEALTVFEKALENVSPVMEVGTRRIGGANYQVPREVRPSRRFVLAARWLIESARNKKGRPMADKLAEEILAAAKNEGNAIKKKQDTHRMAEANRAFAHFGS